jgi:hypothetical protein
VKELRLRGISTVTEANAYAPSFMAAYNARFAKPLKSDFDAHRLLRVDENLDTVLTWREPRKVTKSLTVQYDRVMYLLEDTPENRKLIDRYIEVWEYPDGRIELRVDGRVLTCRQYDRLAEIDQGAVVEHKRLGHVLQVSQAMQVQRDNSRIGKAPSPTHLGAPPKGQTVRRAKRNNANSRRPMSSMRSWILPSAERRNSNPANLARGLRGAVGQA